MKSIKKTMKAAIIYTGCCLALATIANAQTSGQVKNLGNEDVTIIKDYQPVLNDAYKINILPEGDTATFSPPSLKYSVEAEPMNTAFNISPIKPVKIKDDNIKKLYHGFIKAGYGNYNTPLIDVRFNSLRSKSFNAGVEARHLSSTGDIKGYGQPDFSQNKIGVNATRYFDNNALNGDLSFNRDVYHFYGYQSPPELFSKSETRHVINQFDGNFGFKSTHTDKDKLSYASSLAFGKFSDNLNSDESLIDISGSGGKRYNNSYISSGIGLSLMHIDQPFQDRKRAVFRLDPRYLFKKDKYVLTAGANLAYESGDFVKSKLHLYPHLNAQMDILSEEVTVFAQLSGNLKNNTLASFTKENGFLSDLTPLSNTSNNLELSAGITARLSREFIAVGSASIGRAKDYGYYYNLNNALEPVKYSIIYDDADVVKLNASLDYIQSERSSFGISFNYLSLNNDSLQKPLFTPSFKIGIHATYTIAEKIFLKSELYYNDAAYAFNYNPGESSYTKLDGYIDANLGIDYRYSKVLSVWLQANNLGMQKYFRFYNYPSYRLNAMAGITYSFW